MSDRISPCRARGAVEQSKMCKMLSKITTHLLPHRAFGRQPGQPRGERIYLKTYKRFVVKSCVRAQALRKSCCRLLSSSLN